MLDFSFGEVTLVALVAFLVVGPKDFPVVMRAVGRWLGQGKQMLRELQSGVTSVMEGHDMHQEWRGLKEEFHGIHSHIRDLEGKLQPRYDISDLMTPLPKHGAAPSLQVTAQSPSATPGPQEEAPAAPVSSS